MARVHRRLGPRWRDASGAVFETRATAADPVAAPRISVADVGRLLPPIVVDPVTGLEPRALAMFRP